MLDHNIPSEINFLNFRSKEVTVQVELHLGESMVELGLIDSTRGGMISVIYYIPFLVDSISCCLKRIISTSYGNPATQLGPTIDKWAVPRYRSRVRFRAFVKHLNSIQSGLKKSGSDAESADLHIPFLYPGKYFVWIEPRYTSVCFTSIQFIKDVNIYD